MLAVVLYLAAIGYALDRLYVAGLRQASWPGMRSPTDGHASRMRRLFVRIVPVGTVLIAWELATRLNVVNPYVFPPVSEIVLRWVTLIADGTMLGPLWDTLWRALLGLGMAIAIGVPLGLSWVEVARRNGFSSRCSRSPSRCPRSR